MAGAVNGFHSDLVPGFQRLDELFGTEDTLLNRFLHHGLSSAADLLADVGGHALLAGESLEASALAAVAQRSFRIKDQVAVFGSLELIAGVERAVEDQAAAHTGADEESHDVFISLTRAEVVLAQHAQIDVVADVERNAELFAHRACHVVVPPGEVRREEHDAPVLVDDARGAGGNRVELFPVDAGFLDHLLHDADDDFFHVGRGGTSAFGALFQTVNNLVLFVENRAEYLGAPYVETDIVAFSHGGDLLQNYFRMNNQTIVAGIRR